MNVEQLLQKKNIQYKSGGADLIVHCLNPDHDDGNPSMRIDRILGIFNCLSCGFSGNIFTYYEEAYDRVSMQREKLKRKLDKVRSSTVGLEMPDKYTPYIGNWRNISPQTYAKFEAFRSHQPEFVNRIVFPIRDITGRIVVFQGRDETGTLSKKYYNYPRHVPLPMFPTVEAIQGKVIIVEGIFDMLNLHDKGLTNTICIFGVNNFDKEKATNLLLQGVDGVDIILDPDEAGTKGKKEIEELAKEMGLSSRAVNLPEGMDPGELTQAQVSGLQRRLYGD